MKPFTRRVVTPTLLGIPATTASSAPILHFATFGIFRQLADSLPFCLALQYWFSCSLSEPIQSSCHLNAAGCITSIQVPVMLGLSGSLPLRFYPDKSYFRHFDSGLFSFNSSVNTILVLIVQLITLALTISLSTIALYKSTIWRFDKFA